MRRNVFAALVLMASVLIAGAWTVPAVPDGTARPEAMGVATARQPSMVQTPWGHVSKATLQGLCRSQNLYLGRVTGRSTETVASSDANDVTLTFLRIEFDVEYDHYGTEGATAHILVDNWSGPQPVLGRRFVVGTSPGVGVTKNELGGVFYVDDAFSEELPREDERRVLAERSFEEYCR